MKTWYKAVCDKCGEARDVCLGSPIHTYQYLLDDNLEIHQFLIKHSECELRLIWRDDQLDEMYQNGWRRYEETEKGKQEYNSLYGREKADWFKAHNYMVRENK